MAAMIAISFVAGYAAFMLLGYVLFRALFPTDEKVVRKYQTEKMLLLQRARRVRRRERMRTREEEKHARQPVFVLTPKLGNS